MIDLGKSNNQQLDGKALPTRLFVKRDLQLVSEKCFVEHLKKNSRIASEAIMTTSLVILIPLKVYNERLHKDQGFNLNSPSWTQLLQQLP